MSGRRRFLQPPHPDQFIDGVALRAVRRRLRWTQTRLGERLGVTASTVAHIERGRARPGLALARRIREWLAEHGQTTSAASASASDQH